MCTFVCSSGSQIKFDTRENIMESVGFFCNSLEGRKNGITVAITLQQVTTLSSSTAYILMDVAFDRTAETTFVSCYQSQIFGTGCFGK